MGISASQVRQVAAASGGRLFHVTPTRHVASVLAHGLEPSRPSQFDAALLRPGCVYLCTLRVATETLTGMMDVEWGDAVVSLDPLALDPGRFVADEEYWRGEGQEIAACEGDTGLASGAAAALLARFPHMDEPDWILASALEPGTIAYAGPIPASDLRLDFVPRRARRLRREISARSDWGSGISDPSTLEAIDRAQPRLRAWRRFKEQVNSARREYGR